MSSTSRTFMRSVFFAAVAGLATVPALIVAVPLLGTKAVLGLGSVGLAAGYVAVVAPNPARGLRSGAAALILGVALGVVAPGPTTLAFGAAFVLGVVRSGFLYRSRPVRAVLLETALLSSGLALAQFLSSGTDLLSTGLAVWGFFLVQSIYFVIGGIGEHTGVSDDVDPFVKARDAALRLMEDVP